MPRIFTQHDMALMENLVTAIGEMSRDDSWSVYPTFGEMPIWGHHVYGDDCGNGETGPQMPTRYFLEDCPSTPGEGLKNADAEFRAVMNPVHTCPWCNSELEIHSRYTRNYGGGWDTFYNCPSCDFAEVCV